ncbi:MAG: hypothetical protein Kow0089_15350 [Desulfobulbaceae bacterium]
MFIWVMHGLCFALVVVYVNMFGFWAWLSRLIGAGPLAKGLPIIVTLVVLALVSLGFVRRVNRGHSVRLAFLGAGIVAAFLALAIPDPQVPIKRVHVAEYILLAFLVRSTLSHRLQGSTLLFFSILVTALYGVHDEMLQGLHPQRYYGWRDMIVNAVAGLSGGLLAHGLLCCEGETRGGGEKPAAVSPGEVVGFLLLLAAVGWYIVFLYQHREGGLSWYAPLPVVVAGLPITVLRPETILRSTRHHGLQMVFWLSLLLVCYPWVALLAGIPFR